MFSLLTWPHSQYSIVLVRTDKLVQQMLVVDWIPVAGVLIPLRIVDSLTGFGDNSFADALTLYVDRPDLNVRQLVEIRDEELGMIAHYW